MILEVRRGDSGEHCTILSAFVMFENIPVIQLERVAGPPGGGRHSLPLPACLWVCPAGPLCAQLGIPFSTLYPSRVLRIEGAEKPESRDPGPQHPPGHSCAEASVSEIVGPARSQGGGRSSLCQGRAVCLGHHESQRGWNSSSEAGEAGGDRR